MWTWTEPAGPEARGPGPLSSLLPSTHLGQPRLYLWAPCPFPVQELERGGGGAPLTYTPCAGKAGAARSVGGGGGGGRSHGAPRPAEAVSILQPLPEAPPSCRLLPGLSFTETELGKYKRSSWRTNVCGGQREGARQGRPSGDQQQAVTGGQSRGRGGGRAPWAVRLRTGDQRPAPG